MKFEYIEDKVPVAATITAGLALAIALGADVGQGNFKFPVVILSALLALAFVLLTKRKIWMLIPATYMLGGKISVLPLPLTVAHLGILLSFVAYLAMKAIKIIRIKPRVGIVEIWMLVMVVYVATVFIRNPVGVEALGSERVGGRPYIDIIIALIGFWVLSRSTASVQDSVVLPVLSVTGYVFHATVNFIAYHFPSTVGPLSMVYSSIGAAENPELEAPSLEEGGRLAYLQGVGGSLVNLTCSKWRPFTVLNPLRIGRFLLFFVGLGAVLLSGFRSNLVGVFEIFLLGSYFYRGWREVLKASVFMGGLVALLVVVQGNIVDLPLPAQRALSFLPGKWEYAAKAEAEGSTEWRITMWKAMLDGNRYIDNKWLGDGFGFTHRQLEIMAANSTTGTNADQQENLMISGGVHSGPISTIRYVGYIGLVLFLIFLVLIAWRGVQLINRARNTPFFALALLYGIPAILFPLNFVAIFGAFENDFATAIYFVGLQQLLVNSLDALPKPSRETIDPPKFQNAQRTAPSKAHKVGI